MYKSDKKGLNTGSIWERLAREEEIPSKDPKEDFVLCELCDKV